jgi:hypothetical protein
MLRRNRLLQQVTEGDIKGGIEGRGRRGRRRRKLLDYLKERRGYSHLKEDALDRTMWRGRFGPLVRQTTKLMYCICRARDRPHVVIINKKELGLTESVIGRLLWSMVEHTTSENCSQRNKYVAFLRSV